MATPKKANPDSSRFKKGQSGNPGGRSPRVGPNGETVAQLARQHTSEMISVLVRVAKKDGHPQPVAAANAILDRGWGKPREQEEGGSSKEDLGKALLELISRLPQ